MSFRRATSCRTPRNSAAGCREQLPGWSEEAALERYLQALAGMESLSARYIVAALRQRGCEFPLGLRFTATTLAELCGIADPHRRLFHRLLEILEEEQLLRRSGEHWEVVRRPDASSPDPLWRELVASFPEAEAELTLLHRCGSALAEVLAGTCDPLGLLFPDGDGDTLARIYQESPGATVMNRLIRESVQAALARLPAGRGIRVLEIGAGTGGTTAAILPCLPPDRTEYVFTDVSPLFTTTAKRKFASHPFVTYQVLDIERSPESQGFEPQQYDVVIAANVLHATRNLRESLLNARQLLAPGGLLLLWEGTAPSAMARLDLRTDRRLVAFCGRAGAHQLSPDHGGAVEGFAARLRIQPHGGRLARDRSDSLRGTAEPDPGSKPARIGGGVRRQQRPG